MQLKTDHRGERLIDSWLVNADLSYQDLSGLDLSGSNLRFADLRNANLAGCNLQRCDLRNADLRGADLSGIDLEGIDLQGVIITDAEVEWWYETLVSGQRMLTEASSFEFHVEVVAEATVTACRTLRVKARSEDHALKIAESRAWETVGRFDFDIADDVDVQDITARDAYLA
ncbi:MAG: pentapeptide repeat-containing protein [Cyanobacteria bacterium J06607_13]